MSRVLVACFYFSSSLYLQLIVRVSWVVVPTHLLGGGLGSKGCTSGGCAGTVGLLPSCSMVVWLLQYEVMPKGVIHLKLAVSIDAWVWPHPIVRSAHCTLAPCLVNVLADIARC